MSTCTPVSITFKRTDSIPSYIEQSCREIADYFSLKQNQTKIDLSNFCNVIKTSKRWTIQNLKNLLDGWRKIITKTISGKWVDLVYNAYSSCQSTKDIHKLRGMITEALVIAAHGGAKVLGMKEYGWGALVIISKDKKSAEVKYVCTKQQENDCSRRSTVDFGFWNGETALFYECKASPAGIGCKEVMYMNELRANLNKHKINHELMFMCPEDVVSVRQKLKKMGKEKEFIPIGYNNLFLE
ncbi:hypothetical protein FORC48_3640 [Bacillus cereus]|uniref:hypothetical protein n=1 Tax=Bacillus cereus TaxID=1396 RepID=UPI000B59AC14|nr:hypothetical protein [Bacillus cereus]ASI84720.1 hypothetical protein FORC48_3640 [Bacillus cereus]